MARSPIAIDLSRVSLFDRKEENAKLNAELDRISALPLPDLAAEVMTKGFGPDGPGAEGPAQIANIAGEFNPAQGSIGIDDQALIDMYVVVAEGVQFLEHACLLRIEVAGSGGVYGMNVMATRLGRAALEQNKVEHVIGGGTLQPQV
jgi:hypothetical protein